MRANIKKNDIKDKAISCIVIVAIGISLIDYIYIIYYMSYLLCGLYCVN